MQLADPYNLNNPLSNIRCGENETSISITKSSNLHFQRWCSICREIANEKCENKIAADVERGFFKWVEDGFVDRGCSILHQWNIDSRIPRLAQSLTSKIWLAFDLK